MTHSYQSLDVLDASRAGYRCRTMVAATPFPAEAGLAALIPHLVLLAIFFLLIGG